MIVGKPVEGMTGKWKSHDDRYEPGGQEDAWKDREKKPGDFVDEWMFLIYQRVKRNLKSMLEQ